ncbi:MAG: oligosaccharide flippase family protein [Bacteroidetes bacterium]|nr:oligosaccharide flippase family protein [Bacteroidota bacterium]
MSIIKKLAGQTMVYGLGTIVPRLLNYLLLTPFYTRIFLQNEYGVVTELYAYVAFLLVLLTYGMETTYFRYAEKENNPAKVFSTSFITLLTTSLLFVFLIVIFRNPVAGLIEYSSHSYYIVLLVIIVSLDAVSAIPFARLRRENKAAAFAALKCMNVCINIGLNLFFFVLCRKHSLSGSGTFLASLYSEDIGVGYAFISNLAATGLTFLFLLPGIVRHRMSFDAQLLRKMIVYTFPLLIVGLSGMINEVADKIMLKFLVTIPESAFSDQSAYVMSQIGIYGANYKLAVLMMLFVQMFRYAAEPFFFAQAKESESRKVYADVMKYFIISGFIIFLGVMLFIDAVKYFIGRDFHEGLAVVPVVLLANLCFGVFYNLSVWYKLTDRTRYGAFVALGGATVTIVLNFILVPVMGYAGAAWATFFCYFSMMAASYFLGRKFFPVAYDLKSALLYCVVALAVFFFDYYVDFDLKWLNYLVNTVLFLSFLLFAVKREKIRVPGRHGVKY